MPEESERVFSRMHGTFEIPAFIPPPDFSVDEGLEDYQRRMVAEYGPEKAYVIFLASALQYCNIRPKFESDLSNREKLHTEPGIIFSNHPGEMDIPLIFRALTDDQHRIRDDFLILLGEETFQNFVKMYGEKHFVPASRGLAKRIFDQKVLPHIQQGGIFIIFPTGDSKQPGKLKFQNGLSYLLQHVSSETMLYHFSINPSDYEGLNSPRGGTVRIKERYSRAAEWQRRVVGLESRECMSENLSDYYTAQHQDNLT